MTTEERLIQPNNRSVVTHKSYTPQLSNLILTIESVFQTVQLPCASNLSCIYYTEVESICHWRGKQEIQESDNLKH